MNLRIAILLLICTAFSYTASSQIQWGVKAGGNLSGMLLKEDIGYTRVKLRPGFHIGGTADIPLSGKFYLQPALQFTTKGFKIDKYGQDLSGLDYMQFTSYHLELPVNIVFKPKVGNGKMLLGVGPYIAYGIGGRWKAGADRFSVTGKLKFKNDISIADSANIASSRTVPYTKPFDLGANLLVGYEFNKHFYFHLNGQLGLINIDPTLNGVSDETSSMKTVQGGLSIGYKF